MQYTLKELLDVAKLQELLDSLDEVQSLPSAIIDTEGNILTATAWQDICTKFHRVNPDTKKKCIESDLHIGTQLTEDMSHVIYRCPMGLVDTATPIIIEGKHLGNVFTGQLFMEPPDESYFKEQAHQNGFDEKEYLEAMRKVPIFSKEQLHKNLAFIAKLAQMLAEQVLQTIRQRKALQALQKSEEFTRSIVSSSTDCIKVLDLEGHILSFSEGGQKLLEMEDVRPYLGLSWIDFWQDNEDSARRVVEQAARGDVGTFTGYCPTVKGTPKWWEVIVSPIMAADGTIENLLAVSRDITERKQAEDHAKHDAARFESLLRISQYNYDSIQDLLDYVLHEAISLTQSKIGYIYHYDEAQKQFTLNSWSKNVMKQCSVIEPQTLYALEKTGLWGETVRQRIPIIINDYHVASPYKKGCPEGHAPLKSFMTVPVFSQDAIVAVVGVANKESAYTDADVQQLILVMDVAWKVTDKAIADLKLLERDEEYFSLFEQMHSGLIVMDVIYDENGLPVDYRLVSANTEFEIQTNLKRNEEIGRTSAELSFKWPASLVQRFFDIAENGGKFSYERYNESLNRHYDVRAFSHRKGQWAIIFNDITERKNLEVQLHQSQKMEAVGLLAGGVAHDFNNILTVISGYCSLLQMGGGLSDEQKESLEQIATSAEKAAQLTNGLLAFSRKQPLIMKHENLNDIVRHVHKFLARIIGEDITLQSTCCIAELPVLADRGQIEQILINLATNARDAMSGGGVFTVKSDHAVLDSSFTSFHNYNVPPGRYALLTVSDTGTGISKEHIDHIFEPFFTTKEVGKGTGLGMAIIFGIVKQHNGFINVSSEPGHGTIFRIYLPIDENTNGFCTIEAESVMPTGGNETILVAEDDPSVRALVVKVLQSHGYNVVLAEDGVDAVEKFKVHQDSIRLILMDMIMPKKNGKAAYEEISRIKPGVKLIFISGYTADFIGNRGFSEEAIELIMKPVQPMELLTRIREMLNR